jgi:hypothetical protein
MICLQIPGGHGACGHEEAASESDVQDIVANPARFVRREEWRARRAREDGEDARRRGDGDGSRSVVAEPSLLPTLSPASDLEMPRIFTTKKKEKGVTVAIQTLLTTDT